MTNFIRNHWRRLGIFGLGLIWLLFGVAIGGIPSENYVPYFWGPWFWMTGLVTVFFAIIPSSFNLYRWAGTLGVVGVASRVGAAFIKANTGGYTSYWQFVVAFIVYGLLTLTLSYFWLNAVSHWHQRIRKHHTKLGD